MNAAQVAARGVGRVVDTDAAEIARALEELLADPAARREARRFADVSSALGSSEIATEMVASLCRRAAAGQPGRR